MSYLHVEGVDLTSRTIPFSSLPHVSESWRSLVPDDSLMAAVLCDRSHNELRRSVAEKRQHKLAVRTNTVVLRFERAGRPGTLGVLAPRSPGDLPSGCLVM